MGQGETCSDKSWGHSVQEVRRHSEHCWFLLLHGRSAPPQMFLSQASWVPKHGEPPGGCLWLLQLLAGSLAAVGTANVVHVQAHLVAEHPPVAVVYGGHSVGDCWRAERSTQQGNRAQAQSIS